MEVSTIVRGYFRERLPDEAVICLRQLFLRHPSF